MVDVNATTLRVWEWGSDDPTAPLVILGHGAFDHGRMMDGMGAALSDRGLACWALDMRGHGDSGRIFQGSTFVPMLADLGAFVDLLGRRRIGLLGHSMGGSLFLHAAATWPQRFDWVVALDSVGPPAAYFERPGIGETCRGAFDQLVKAVARSARVFPDKQAMFDQRIGLNTRVPEAWMWHLVEHGSSPHEGGHRWKYDSMFNSWLPDAFRPEWILEDFKVIDIPVMVLTGGEEELWSDVPLDEIEGRLSLIRRAQHRVVPDAGHYVHLENEPFVLDATLDFMSEAGW